MKQQIQAPQAPYNDNQNKKDLVIKIHGLYYSSINFKEIDYIVGQPLPQMLEISHNKQLSSIVIFAEQCLAFTEKGFNTLYYYLLKVVMNEHQQWNFRNQAADLLITMNGENDKVYNFKKTALRNMENQLESTNQSKGKDKINRLQIDRQLKLNSAIAMKNRKSSSVYEYRLWLIEYLILSNRIGNQKGLNQFISDLHHSQHCVMTAVLDRFPRNYFCSMYRLRFFKHITYINSTFNIYIKEIQMVWNFVEKNPNDYSSLSYIRFLIRNSQKQDFHSKILNLILQNCIKLLQFCKVAYEQSKSYSILVDLYKEIKPNVIC